MNDIKKTSPASIPDFQVQQFQELINVFMRFENGFELNILPELISIPELDIMKTIVVILLEGVEVNIPIIGEFICKAVITPVAITKEDKFRIVIKWDSLCIGVGPVQTFGRSHMRSEGNLEFYIRPRGYCYRVEAHF
jgi:hypothetical protein